MKFMSNTKLHDPESAWHEILKYILIIIYLSGLKFSGSAQYSSSLCSAQTLPCIHMPAGIVMPL